MSGNLVLSGLIKKRAEIAGQIEEAQRRIRMLVIDLDAVDATIRLFDPNIDLAEIKPKPVRIRHQAYKGEVTRLIFSTLRNAETPMTAPEIAHQVILARGLNPSHKQLVKVIERRVAGCLSYNKARGIIRATKDTGRILKWSLI